MPKIHLIFPFLLLEAVCPAQITLKGYVFDAKDASPLAFVNIGVGDGRALAATSIDGSFELTLPRLPDSLIFSYVGYLPYVLKSAQMTQTLRIAMQPMTRTLDEVLVKDSENPALRIIRQAAKNRKANDPAQLDAYRCKTYNKFFITVEKPTPKPGFDPFAHEELALNDKNTQFFNANHLFIMESITERKYKRPDRALETVLANRVSGFKQPFFTTLANTFQPFAFYESELTVMGKTYTNPIAKGAEKKYFYQLEDTLYDQQDTVFVISFEPQNLSENLRGILSIHTQGYAIQSVVAVTKARPDANFEMQIQQLYERKDGYWFPKQINTDIVFKNEADASQGFYIQVGGKSLPLKAVGRSYVSEVEINPVLRSREFGRLAIEYDPKASRPDSTLWQKYRSESLTFVESNTFRTIDSVFEWKNLEKKILGLSYLIKGRIPFGVLDIELRRLMLVNLREALRLGLGLRTNQKLSRHFNFGGYFGYGFRDAQWKYGGDVNFFLTKKNALTLNFSYSQDLTEAGGMSFYRDHNLPGGEQLRNYFISNFDQTQTLSASLSGYALKYLDFAISVQKITKQSTTSYRYLIPEATAGLDSTRFSFSQLHLGLRYAFRTTYIEFLGEEIPGSYFKYPIIWVNFMQGFRGIADGQFAFMKLETKIQKSFQIKGFGNSSISMAGAAVLKGDLPYSHIYTLPGSFVSDAPIEVPNALQTVAPNEFYGNRQFIALYYHRFKQWDLHKRSKPRLVLFGAAAWSSDTRPQLHTAYILRTAERGIFESGIILNNLFVNRFSGYGVGVFYRLGHYASGDWRINLAYKLAFTFTM